MDMNEIFEWVAEHPEIELTMSTGYHEAPASDGTKLTVVDSLFIQMINRHNSKRIKHAFSIEDLEKLRASTTDILAMLYEQLERYSKQTIFMEE